jgi:heme exporter protein D
MSALGPHAIFILAAYAVTFLAIAALALFVIDDDRRQRRLIAEFEARGIKRRSAKPKAPKRKGGT